MTAIHLAVVPRRFRNDQFMHYPVPIAKNVKRMNPFCTFVVREFRSVVGSDDVPAHQRGFGYRVLPTDVVDVFVNSVQFYRLEFSYYLVWTISLVCAIILHRVIESFLIVAS